MRDATRLYIVGAALIAQLFTAGCRAGGLFDVFGLTSGGSSDSAQSSSDSSETIAESVGGSGSDLAFGGAGAVVSTAATLHNPEPAGLVLFGGGLAGIGLLRRRRKTVRR